MMCISFKKILCCIWQLHLLSTAHFSSKLMWFFCELTAVSLHIVWNQFQWLNLLRRKLLHFKKEEIRYWWLLC